MLVSGGKILALGKVFGNESLVGSGTPDHPLGVNTEWLQEYISSAAGDTTPYSGISPIKIEHHKVSFNSAGFASESWVKAQKYAPSAWADNRYAKKTDLPDLDPYALKTDVYTKDEVYTKQQANDTFIPRTASGNWDVQEYSAGNGIGISQHKISVTADYVLKTWLAENYYDKDEVDNKLAELGGYKVVDGDPVTHEPDYDGSDKSKWIFLTEDPDAAEPDKYFEWIWYNNAWKCIGETSMDLDGYATDEELQTAIDNLSATYLKKEDFHDTTYTEGANIHIYGNDNTISGRDWTPELTTIQDDVDKKLYTSAFNNWSAHAFDGYATESWVNGKLEPYATTEWVTSNFSGKDALADEFAKYYTKNEADETFVSADTFNSYTQEIDEDLRNISASLDDKIDKTASANWDLKEYSGKDGIKIENHWVSISSNFVTPEALTEELKGYYTKDETSGAEALAEEFAKYQPSGNYITSAAADEKYIPKTWSAEKDFTPYSGGEGVKVENHIISLSAVPQNIEITSHDESVKVSKTPDPQTGITTYDLTVLPPAAEVKISGENGVSAQYDEATSAWLVGLEEQTYEYLEAKETDTTTVTAAKQVLNNFDAITVIGSNISVVDGQITFGNTGLYHIDMQVDVTVADTDLSYYTVLLELANYNSPTIGDTIKATTHEIDWSYEHTETINVSFDFKVNNIGTGTAVVISQLPLQGKASVRVRNLNIHEVVTIDKVVEAALPTYSEGTAIAIQDSVDGKSIGVNVGLGLSANPITNTLNVACGSGLKIDDQGGVMAVTLDEVTEQVVETVQQLEEDMETKITTNFPQAGITHVNSYVPGGTASQYQSNKGFVYGNLFNIAMNHKIEIGKTYLGVYCKQNDNQNKYILGIYEYQPDYDRGDGTYGRTVAKCDTGFVEILPGFHEYPVIHLNNTIGTTSAETDDTMNTKNFYYAAIFFPKNRNGEQGLWLGSAPGYNTQLNECKPQLMCAYNDIPAETGKTYSNDLSFNDFGFTWAYDNYDNPTSTHGSTAPMECFDSMRFFMQIRNHQ
jgi:hypothetical protein